MHKFSAKGFVIIAVMSHLFVLALLTLSALSQWQVTQKSVHYLGQYETVFQAVSGHLTQIERQLVAGSIPSHCVQAPQSGGYFYGRSQSWWRQQEGCQHQGNGLKSRYFVELLPSYACLQIAGAKQPGVRYYRVSLSAVSANRPQVSLQSTVALYQPVETVDCPHIERVPAGRQSWVGLMAS